MGKNSAIDLFSGWDLNLEPFFWMPTFFSRPIPTAFDSCVRSGSSCATSSSRSTPRLGSTSSSTSWSSFPILSPLSKTSRSVWPRQIWGFCSFLHFCLVYSIRLTHSWDLQAIWSIPQAVSMVVARGSHPSCNQICFVGDCHYDICSSSSPVNKLPEIFGSHNHSVKMGLKEWWGQGDGIAQMAFALPTQLSRVWFSAFLNFFSQKIQCCWDLSAVALLREWRVQKSLIVGRTHLVLVLGKLVLQKIVMVVLFLLSIKNVLKHGFGGSSRRCA